MQIAPNYDSIVEIARQFGTPLYVYDLDVIRQRAENLIDAFRGWDVYYSLKANPCVLVADTIRKAGAKCEVASIGEVAFAKAAGWSCSEIAFAGPGKRRSELLDAVSCEIGLLHLESRRELEILRDSMCGVALSCRVNIGLGRGSAREQMAGESSRFGFDVDEAIEIIATLRSSEWATISGLHFYAASGLLDQAEIEANFEAYLSVIDRIVRRTGWTPTKCVFGPGIGVPYSSGQQPIDLDSLAGNLRSKLGGHVAASAQWAIEVGRYLVAPGGVFTTTVLDVKQSGKVSYVITDGGMNCFTRPTFLGQEHPLVVSSDAPAVGDSLVVVGGPTCTPLDILAEPGSLRGIRPGSVIGIGIAGAYGRTMSFTEFLGHDAPGEVVVERGKARWARRPVAALDRLQEQALPLFPE